MPELNALGEKHSRAAAPGTIDPSRPLGSSLEAMSPQGPEYADLAALARRHGFDSAEQWANVGDRTLRAYGAAAGAAGGGDMEALYQQGIANIQNDAKLNASQQALILERMAKSHQRNLEAMRASEQDLAAVQPHMKKLEALFD